MTSASASGANGLRRRAGTARQYRRKPKLGLWKRHRQDEVAHVFYIPAAPSLFSIFRRHGYIVLPGGWNSRMRSPITEKS